MLPTIKNTIFVVLSVYVCFKSFWIINILGYVIHGYLLVRPSGKNKNKSRVDYEPRSAHGRAVNKKKSRVNLEPRSARGRAVKKNKNKSRVNL